MKSQVAPYKRPLYCLRIECANGAIVRLAQYPFDVKISGQTYLAGYDFTGIEFGTTFTPSSVDLKSFIGFADITEAKIQSGIFDNAKAYVFATDWNTPVVDYEPITKAVFGKVTQEDNKYTVEWMTLVDLTNQTVGYSYAVPCQKTFGGQEPKGCLVDVVALRVTGAIDTVVSETQLYDAARIEAEDYFGCGKLWFATGLNVGIPAKKINWSENGFFNFDEPWPYAVTAGDEYIAEPGCRKSMTNCVEKFDNILNHGGFYYVPGESILKTVGDK